MGASSVKVKILTKIGMEVLNDPTTLRMAYTKISHRLAWNRTMVLVVLLPHMSCTS